VLSKKRSVVRAIRPLARLGNKFRGGRELALYQGTALENEGYGLQAVRKSIMHHRGFSRLSATSFAIEENWLRIRARL
jgi:hypothetical protein